MKFNVFFTMKGPGGVAEVPTTAPVESANLASLLARLAQNLPTNKSLGTETIGIRVEPTEEKPK